VSDHLPCVKRKVRGQLFQPDIPLTGPDRLRSPVLHREGGPIYAWPPSQPSLVEQMGGFAEAERAAVEARARQRERAILPG
jgi:hypothetical protein